VSDKILEPGILEYNNIINKFKNIDINRLTPKDNLGRTKRIKECTPEEVQAIFWSDTSPFLEIIDLALKAYRSRDNICGNLLLSLRNRQNDDVIKANVIALTLMGLVYGYTQEFQDNMETINEHALNAIIQELQEKLNTERDEALEERKKHRTSKIIGCTN